jgi:hypothetical protein
MNNKVYNIIMIKIKRNIGMVDFNNQVRYNKKINYSNKIILLLIIKIKIMFNLKIFRILNFLYKLKKINRSLKNKSRFYKIQIRIQVELFLHNPIQIKGELFLMIQIQIKVELSLKIEKKREE